MKLKLFAFFTYIKDYKLNFFFSQIFSLVTLFSQLSFPFLVGKIFEVFESKASLNAILFWTGLMVIDIFMLVLSIFLNKIIIGSIVIKTTSNLRLSMLNKLLVLPLDEFEDVNSGDYSSTLTNDLNLFQEGLEKSLKIIIENTILLIGIFVIIFFLDWSLSILVAIMAPILFFISNRTGKKTNNLSNKLQDQLGKILNVFQEAFSGIMVIKLNNLEDKISKKFTGINLKLISTNKSNLFTIENSMILIRFVNYTFFVLLIVIGGIQMYNDKLQLHELISYIMYTEMIAVPIMMLVNAYVDIRKAEVATKRIDKILFTNNSYDNSKKGEINIELQDIEGSIEFRDVSFSYGSGIELFNKISLNIKPKSKIAIVGESGAGKSTLAKLLVQLYKHDSGLIMIDDFNILDMDVSSLRKIISYIPQETFLFNDSILENIKCGLENVSFEEIREAAKKANAHSFIMEQSDAYDTIVGEVGMKLSVGQKQRIALARAFLRDPKILILDEPTASLDRNSAEEVFNALNELQTGRTTIVITHNLDSIRDFDCIYYVKDGKVLDEGFHLPPPRQGL